MAVQNSQLDIARFVFKEVTDVKKNSKIQNKSFKSYAKKIPTYIQTNGLLATMAFIKGKAGDGQSAGDSSAYGAMYDILSEHVKKSVFDNDSSVQKRDLVEILSDPNMTLDQYKWAEKEVMNVFLWMRRFAEGELR